MFQRDLKEKDLPSIIRLSPSLPSMANAVAEIFLHLQWKTAAVISIGKSPNTHTYNYIHIIALNKFYYANNVS